MPAHHRAKNNSANKVIRGKAITLQKTATHGPVAGENCEVTISDDSSIRQLSCQTMKIFCNAIC